jgi:hypothetical protein
MLPLKNKIILGEIWRLFFEEKQWFLARNLDQFRQKQEKTVNTKPVCYLY